MARKGRDEHDPQTIITSLSEHGCPGKEGMTMTPKLSSNSRLSKDGRDHHAPNSIIKPPSEYGWPGKEGMTMHPTMKLTWGYGLLLLPHVLVLCQSGVSTVATLERRVSPMLPRSAGDSPSARTDRKVKGWGEFMILVRGR